MPIEKELDFKDTFSNAQLFYSKGQFDRALSALEIAYKIKPEDFEVNYLAGKIFYTLKHYPKAKRIFSELNEIKPEDINIKLYLAYTYYYTGRQAGDLTIAGNIVNEIIKQSDKNIYALELKADILMGEKQYEDALEIYENIKNGVDNFHRLIFKEAICYFYIGSHAETLRLCTQLYEAGFKKSPEVKQLYEASKKRQKSVFLKAFGKTTWAQKVFAFLFDPYIDKALSLHADAERRTDYTKRKLFTDQLTQINNRNCFKEKGEPLFKSSKVYTLIQFDIDKFKNINDTYGHDKADRVLYHFAQAGRAIFRNHFYRMGGEEFLAVYEGYKNEAFFAAEKFRKLIESEVTEKVNKELGIMLHKVTCSGGMAEYPIEVKTFDEAYSLADKRLYYSKEHGRNLVTIDGAGLEKAQQIG